MFWVCSSWINESQNKITKTLLLSMLGTRVVCYAFCIFNGMAFNFCRNLNCWRWMVEFLRKDNNWQVQFFFYCEFKLYQTQFRNALIRKLIEIKKKKIPSKKHSLPQWAKSNFKYVNYSNMQYNKWKWKIILNNNPAPFYLSAFVDAIIEYYYCYSHYSFYLPETVNRYILIILKCWSMTSSFNVHLNLEYFPFEHEKSWDSFHLKMV